MTAVPPIRSGLRKRVRMVGFIAVWSAGALAGARATFAEEAAASHRKWMPMVHLTTKGGNDRTIGRADLMMPVLQGRNDMLFADVRATLAERGSYEGNFGGGYRHLFRSTEDPKKGVIVGAYAFFDRRRSEHGNFYSQKTFGVELLHNYFELRANLYRPEPGSNEVAERTVDESYIQGSTLVTETVTYAAMERPMHGFDVEAGAGLPIGKKCQLWGYAGYYRFSTAHTPNVDGPRFRIQYEWDEPLGWGGSRLYLGFEIQHDEVRDWDAFATATLSIPICLPFRAKKDRRTFEGIDGRMTRPIIRDVDVVTFAEDINKPLDSDEGPKSGTRRVRKVRRRPVAPLAHVYYMANVPDGGAGTQADPFSPADAEAHTGPGDTIVALNDHGPIDVSGASAGTLNLKLSQNLFGVGDGVSKTFVLPGLGSFTVNSASGRPWLTRGAGADVVTVAGNNRIEGVGIDGGDCGIAGDGVSNVVIVDTPIQHTRVAGVYFRNSSNIRIDNSPMDHFWGGRGMWFQDMTGDITINGTPVRNAAGGVIAVDGGAPNVSYAYSGAFTNTAGPLISYANVTGGSLSFTGGAITDTGWGVDIQDSAGEMWVNNVTLAGQVGVSVVHSFGEYHFSGVTITNTLGPAVLVSAGAPVVDIDSCLIEKNNGGRLIGIWDTTGGSVSIHSSSLLGSGACDGVVISNAYGQTHIDDLTLFGSAGGLDIQGGGAVSMTFANMGIVAASAPGIHIDGGSNTAWFGGSVMGMGVSPAVVENTAGGSLTFDTVFAGMNGVCVTLTNNAANMQFRGSIEQDQGTGLGLSGNSGDIYFRDVVIDQVTGHGVTVKNNSGDVDIQTVSIDQPGGSGVYLRNNTGSFSILGGPTASEDSTITATVGPGIDAENVGDMYVNDARISEPGQAAVHVKNLNGAFTLTNAAISGASDYGVWVENDAPNQHASVLIQGLTVTETLTPMSSGVEISVDNPTSTMSATILNSTFSNMSGFAASFNAYRAQGITHFRFGQSGAGNTVNNTGYGVIVTAGGLGTNPEVHATVEGNTFNNLWGGSSVWMEAYGNSTLTTAIRNNLCTLDPAAAAANTLLGANNFSTLNATVTNNTLIGPGAPSFRGAVGDAGATMRLNAQSNSDGAGGPPVQGFSLANGAGGTFEVQDYPNLSANNHGVSVSASGPITNTAGPIPTP